VGENPWQYSRDQENLDTVTFQMNLKPLLLVHGFITLAAGVVLIVSPGLIPGIAGVNISGAQVLLCYLLAAAELSISFLSFAGRGLTDVNALRVISLAFIIFHLVTAVLEGFAFFKGIPAAILYNIPLRLVMAGLLYYYGVYKKPYRNR
jgi:hypothetical protein